MSISILVLTYNEQQDLPSCLSSVQWADDIVVVDSGSTDDTVAIATSMGARVIERPFDNFAGQRNFGIDHGDLKHDWVFHLDADEHVRPELADELVKIAGSNSQKAYRVAGRIYFRNKWIRRSSMYPCYQVRFGRKDHLRFKMAGHGQRETIPANEVATLENDLDHYSFSKGIANWFEKHNRYSTDEAMQIIADVGKPIAWGNLLSSSGTSRRRELKRIAGRMPLKPLLRFIYLYILKLGFLDGAAGYQYAKMMGMYERMIALKVHQLQQDKVKPPTRN